MNSSNQIQPITTASEYYLALTHLPPKNCTAKTNNGKIKQLSCTGYNLFEYNGYQIFFMYENNSPDTKKIIVIKTEPTEYNGDRTFKTLGKITETSTIILVNQEDITRNYGAIINASLVFKTVSNQPIIIPILQLQKSTDKPTNFVVMYKLYKEIKITTDGTSFLITPLLEETANTANTANTNMSTVSSEIEPTENNPKMTSEEYKKFLRDNKLINDFSTMFWMPIKDDALNINAFILYIKKDYFVI